MRSSTTRWVMVPTSSSGRRWKPSGDVGDDGEDPPSQVRTAGGAVVVGGVVQGLDARDDCVVTGVVVAVQLLQRTAREDAAGADGVEAVLLVAAAGDVVREDPAGLAGLVGVEVVAGKQWHDGEALHGHREVVADEQRQAVGLALEAEGRAFDLLVVLELDLEQAHELD